MLRSQAECARSTFSPQKAYELPIPDEIAGRIVLAPKVLQRLDSELRLKRAVPNAQAVSAGVRNAPYNARYNARSYSRYFLTTLPPIPSIARFIGSFVSRIQPISPPSIAPGFWAVSRCLR
jgi:hypothetical protein